MAEHDGSISQTSVCGFEQLCIADSARPCMRQCLSESSPCQGPACASATGVAHSVWHLRPRLAISPVIAFLVLYLGGPVGNAQRHEVKRGVRES